MKAKQNFECITMALFYIKFIAYICFVIIVSVAELVIAV